MTAAQDDVLIFLPRSSAKKADQNLDAEILLAHLRRAGFRASIVDGAVSRPDRFDARVVLWLLSNRHELSELRRAASSPSRLGGFSLDTVDTLHLAGGPFAHRDFQILESLPGIAAVLRGEMEAPAEALCHALRRGEPWQEVAGLTVRGPAGVVRNPAPKPPDPDHLPAAADDLFHPDRRQDGQKILFNRGCDSDCQYCGYQLLYRQDFPGRTRFWRSRSARRIADEIELYVRRHGVERFVFHAAVFFGYDRRGAEVVEEVAEEILRRDLEIRFKIVTHPHHLVRNRHLLPLLERAGLDLVYLGADSGSTAALRRFQVEFDRDDALAALELLHSRRMTFTPGFIFYDPYMTLGEVKEQLRFLRGIAPCFAHMKATYPWFLDHHLLDTRLKITPHLPLAGRLIEDALVSPSNGLGEIRGACFRDPDVDRFHRLQHTLRARHLHGLRSKLWDPDQVADHPRLNLLPLDLLDRLLDELTGTESATETVNETVNETTVLARVPEWIDAALGGCC